MVLQDLFDKVRYLDVSDANAMINVLAYYEELNEEAEDYMEMLTEKLYLESITWHQPWYQLSHCLTRPLKETDENPEELYCTGTFTKDEIEAVESNWCKFIKKFNVPDKLACVARWRNRENRHVPKEQARIFVVAYLAQGLQRNMYQVYKFIVSHYGGSKRGPYSKDEERVLEICFHHQPKRAVVYASAVLSRECRGIYLRLHENFNGKPPKGKTKWTLTLATKFLRLLLDYTGLSLKGLRNTKIEKEVWLKLEKDFQKPKEYLMYFWNTRLYSQLFIRCNFKLRHLQRKVFKVLRSSSYKVWSDIRWKEVLAKFPDGFTTNLLYSTSVRVLRNYPRFSKDPLKKVVHYALEMTQASRRIRQKHIRFKTLNLNKDGKLEVVYYDQKLHVSYYQ